MLFRPQGCDSLVQPERLGGGKGLVSCPYPEVQILCGQKEEEAVRYGCWGAWEGPWGLGLACKGPGLFRKPGETLSGAPGPPSLVPGQLGTKQPFLCSALRTDTDLMSPDPVARHSTATVQQLAWLPPS